MERTFDQIGQEEQKALLNKGTMPFRILAGLCLAALIAGCLVPMENISRTEQIAGSVVLFGGLGLLFAYFGFRRLLWKPDKQALFIQMMANGASSREIRDGLKAKEAADLLDRFENDRQFQDSVLAKVKKNADKAHDNRVKAVLKEKERLIAVRERELERIDKSRWQSLGYDILVNRTEGILRYQNRNFLFSDIEGAKPYTNYVEKHNYTTTGTTKTSPSIGKAIVGGALFGPTGAIIGGLSGTSKNVSETKDEVTMEVANRGVHLNLGGFTYDIKDAPESLVVEFQALSQEGVPESFTPIDQMPSVLAIDEQIRQIDSRISEVRDEKIVYEIPEKYRRSGHSYDFDGTTLKISNNSVKGFDSNPAVDAQNRG